MVQVVILISNNMTVVDINNTNYDFCGFQHPVCIVLHNTSNTSTLTYKYAHTTTTKHSSRFQYPHSSPFIVVLGTLSIASRIIVLLFCMCLYCHPALCCCCLLLSLLVYEAIMETNFPFVTTTRFCCATLFIVHIHICREYESAFVSFDRHKRQPQ